MSTSRQRTGLTAVKTKDWKPEDARDTLNRSDVAQPGRSVPVMGEFNEVTGVIEKSGSSVLGARKGVKNYNPMMYPKTRKMVASVRAAIAGSSLPVLCVGDSTTEGYYGGDSPNGVARSWVRRLADQLSAMGIRAGWQNVMGNHRSDSQGATIDVVDTRVGALTAGWETLGAIGLSQGIGGYSFTNTANTNKLTFTPTVQTDRLDVYYLDIGGYDGIAVLSGAAGATAPTGGGSITGTGSGVIKKATISHTLGNNVWTVAKATANGSRIIIQGLVAYNSAQPEIQLLNCGMGGQKADAFTANANAWDTLRQVTDAGNGFQAPLAIITLGINDWFSGTSVASYEATLSNLVAAYQAAGMECLLVVPTPSKNASASVAVQTPYWDAVKAVAVEQGCAYIDLPERFGDLDKALALGYYADAGVHPSEFCYVDIAAGIFEWFAAL